MNRNYFPQENESDKVFAFPELEQFHASFIVTEKKNFNGTICKSIAIMAINSYAQQMEYTLRFGHKYNTETGKTVYVWHSHAYVHPGMRSQVEVSAKQGEKLYAKLLEYVEKYPILLFNLGSTDKGRNQGFYRFVFNLVFQGAEHSVKTLENS